MNRLFRWAASRSRTFHIFFGTGLVLAGLIAFAAAATVWEYTNSPKFCGTTCHTMPPEYTAYKVSPHARVACVDCHLGQESILATVPRKTKELRHVIYALTQEYETPIYVKSLRPARFTCEKCHYPEKFSMDSVKVIHHYKEDEQNTQEFVTLILKTGGGSKREGLGKGIHWHIENQVWYIATDKLYQNIPYVRTVDENGQVREYLDVDAELPPDFVERNQDKLRLMDCIDCHNRISHDFRSPERAMDDAIFRRIIASDIPYIKKWGVELLSGPYPDHETAFRAIDRLPERYRIKYPDWYANEANQAKLRAAIQQLKVIYSRTVFPDMDVGWKTHPNNTGHLEFPGCFRCHDGKHFGPQGDAIRLECNICHTIPVVSGPGLPAPVISLAKPNEPDSHRDTTWIARHRFEFDHTCAGCHNVTNAGGADNSSFCANSACHAVEWRYAGLNAPAVRQKLEAEAPPRPERPGPGVAPKIPHPITPRINCKLCHGPGKVRAFPPDHIQETMANCTECHAVVPPALMLLAEPTPTPGSSP